MDMEAARQALAEAMIFRRGSDPAQRERSRELLRQIVREAEGTPQAKKAIILLGDDFPESESPRDPELEELLTTWNGIEGLTDHRLPDFLKRLEAYPGVAVPLRTEVVNRLRKWLSVALERVGEQAEERPALNDFIAVASGVLAYEEIPEFMQLYDVLFHFRLQEIAAQVEEALRAWKVDEAQQTLDALGLVPDGFKAEIKRLQEEIDRVDHLRKGVNEWLSHFPGSPPDSWTEVRLTVDLLQRAQACLATAPLPLERQRQLLEARDYWRATAQNFIRKQALVAVTLDALRQFWTQFASLPLDEARWEMDESWFQAGLAAITASLSREVDAAVTADDLMLLISRLRMHALGLPPMVGARVEEVAGQISQMAAVWKQMQRGEPFEFPAPEQGNLKLPPAFSHEAEQYRGWLDLVNAALSLFKSETSPPLQVYENGLRVAEEVLSQLPHHALAEKLRAEAKRKIVNYHLDDALAHWDVSGFVELVERTAPGEIYTGLLANKKEMLALGDLTYRENFSTWRDAAKWWADWRASKSQFVGAKPDSLRLALLQQEEQRRTAWYAVLEALLKDELPPPEYQAAAASLDGETDPNLETYRHDLLRQATIGRIKQSIRDGQFEQAELELADLPANSTEAVRLRTQLKVARARARGGGATAEVIYTEWQNMRAHVEGPHGILLETIQQVWEAGRQDWLAKLKRVLSQELSTNLKGADPAVAADLTDWEVWLGIEQALLSTCLALDVKRLADYLRTAKPDGLLNQRSQKLVSHWQAQKQTAMLAWSYQAFRRKGVNAGLSLDPAEDLVAETDGVAEQVLTRLVTESDLRRGDLESLYGLLKQEEKKWRDLEDFLSYLPQVIHRQPSAKFRQSKAALENVTKALADVAYLRDADLRQESNRALFEETGALVGQFAGVAAKAALKKELARLEKLTGLRFLELRIEEAAEWCGSEEPIRVLEPGYFSELADWVDQLIQRFAEAEAEGGKMWQVVSDDCCDSVYRRACILRASPRPPDLKRLLAVLKELHDEEVKFSIAIDELEDREKQPKVPEGSEFDPLRHESYLKLIPDERPGSRKVYLRFHRCAQQHPMPTILQRSRRHLPEWVRDEYLEKGVPQCAKRR
ncbi:MAG TPA: hypothetical protein VJ464_17575 [Blastocatellia bacterium]|nr:hypothetical protein [Blastocatellia bacterium]